MRAFKMVIFVVGGLLGLLVLAAIGIILWVDPNDYRSEIEARAQQATGRPVRIAGKLELKLFPWIALQVREVSLGNPAGYGTEPFLTVKHADLGVKLLPLLRKEVEVRRVALEGLAVNLVSRSDEDNNWKDLGQSDEPAAPGTTVARTTIAGVDIKDATLVYRDEAEKSLTRLTHLQAHTGALGSDAPVPIHMEFDYDDGTPESAMHIAADASVRKPPDGSRIEIANLALEGSPMAAKAGAAPDAAGTTFSVRSPQLVLDTDAETLAPATLDIRYGSLPLKATATGEKLFSDRVIAGKIEIERLSPRELMKSMGMEASKARDPRALTALAAKSDYRLTPKALLLSALAIDLDDSHLRGSLGIDDLDTKALSFDLNIDAIDADRYREPEVKPGAQQQAVPPTDLPRDALRKLEAKGVLRIGRLKVADLQLSEASVQVDASGGQVKLTPQAKLFGGAYAGDIHLDARAEPLRLATNGRVRGVDVGSLANALLDTKRLVGRGDMNVALNGSGKTDTQMLKSLAGKYDLSVRDGAVNGVDLWYELRRAYALVKRTAAPTRTEPVRTRFKTMTGNGTLANGVIHDQDLRIDMDYIKARGKGTLAIESLAVDYRLVAEIYKLPADEGAEMADVKAMDIPIAVTGTLDDMKIRPDVGDLLKARVRKEVDKHKDDLKKKLDKKLQNLFNR